jgi:hypothetical protein
MSSVRKYHSRKLPNFFVIGAMKSATSSLYHYLESHPEIHVGALKEPRFFVAGANRDNGWEWYRSLYAEVRQEVAIGDCSPHYTIYPKLTGAPARIAAYLPEAKFIYIMREPIERILSHYWHAVRWYGEKRHLNRAISESEYFTNPSRYAMQIEQYLPYFSLEQFHFLTLEQLQHEPDKALKDCFSFLGVNAHHSLTHLGVKHNKRPAVVTQTYVPFQQARALLAPVRNYIPETLKAPLRDWGERPANQSQRLNAKLKRQLESLFQEENKRLFELIGARYSEWEL